MLSKNRRQIDFIGGRSWRVMQRCEQDVLFQAAGVRFHSLQDARVKRMKEIAVAQEKADHFRSLFQNPAGLRIGTKFETADRIEYPRARFSAYL